MVALGWLLFRSRLELMMENLALRQQLAIFKCKRTRPRLAPADRLFWVFLRGAWRNWANALIIVEPATVVHWHRQGFRLFWRWISRPRRAGVHGFPAKFKPSSGAWRGTTAGGRQGFTQNCSNWASNLMSELCLAICLSGQPRRTSFGIG